MPHPARPRPAVIGALLLVLSVLCTLVTDPGPTLDGPSAGERRSEAAGETGIAGRGGTQVQLSARGRRAARTTYAGWSGFAFDACRAPSQRTMDTWLRTSPFLGVGIYLGGVHRACPQRHLTRGWVTRQTRAGWRLLPLWVGPQAPCTGYQWRIDARPGPAGRHGAAAADGAREAQRAVAAAQRLGIGHGATLWYDLEPFDTAQPRCRHASLTFLDAWTRSLHRRGYYSGLYSHVNSGVALMSRAHARYARPDRVWFAWVNYRADAAIPSRFVRKRTWMEGRRVHQFALDKRVRFGGVSMDIDWNWVSLGRSPGARRPATCGLAAERSARPVLRTGRRGRAVSSVQCLLRTVGHKTVAASGRYDDRTAQVVTRFQRSRGLRTSGVVDRRTWLALLSAGPRPVLKQGSAGPSVRRLQRSLDAALPGRVKVHGGFDGRTVAAVRRYQALVGLRPSGIVAEGTWKALSRGKVSRPDKAKVRRAPRRR